jgi:hypothetical protein
MQWSLNNLKVNEFKIKKLRWKINRNCTLKLITTNYLDVSTNFLYVSTTFLDVLKNFLDVSMNFLDVSTKFQMCLRPS